MSKKKWLKKPKAKNTPLFQTANIPAPEYDNRKPVFSFQHMRYGKKHCLSICEKSDRAAIASRLVRISQKTWRELKSEPKEGIGFEEISRKSLNQGVTVPQFVTPETIVTAFRFSESGRMVGFRQAEVYHVIAVGSNLYPH